MGIKVILFAKVAEICGAHVLEVEDVSEGTSVGQLLVKLKEQHPQLEDALKACIFTVNIEQVDLSYRLSLGDEFAIIPPVSGG